MAKNEELKHMKPKQTITETGMDNVDVKLNLTGINEKKKKL